MRRSLCSGYLYHSARAQGVEEYANLLTGMPCHLHPSSALRVMGASPDYVVYHELVYTSKEHMICVSAVDPEWLVEAGPRFFRLREGANSRKRAAEAAAAARAQLEEGVPPTAASGGASVRGGSGSLGGPSTPAFSDARFTGLSTGGSRLPTMQRWAAADAETPMITSGGMDDDFHAGAGAGETAPGYKRGRGKKGGGSGSGGGTRQGIAAAMARLQAREFQKRGKTPKRSGF